MPGDPGGPVATTRVLFSAHGAAGAAGTRHSPRPPFSGAMNGKTLGRNDAAGRKRMFGIGEGSL